ncbi:MAG TPA: hypothetical protein VIC87_07045 [Vicinamibacteria bacterium]
MGKSQTLDLTPRGLCLQENDLSARPGSLSQADDVVIQRDGILEPRRGAANVATKALTRLGAFKGALLGWGSNTLSRSTDSGASWADYSGTYAPPSGYPLRGAEAGGSYYFTTGAGVQRLDAVAGTPLPAGVPAAADPTATLTTAAGTAMEDDGQVAYRLVYGLRDANDVVHLGAPSGLVTVVNAAQAGPHDVTLVIPVPVGIPESPYVRGGTYFFQVYRSVKSAAEADPPSTSLALVGEGDCAVWSNAVATTRQRATNVVTVTTLEDHDFAVGDVLSFHLQPAGYTGSYIVTVASVPDSTSFTYAETGADDGPVPGVGFVDRVGVTWTDTVPDDLRDAALYTNDAQEGPDRANFPPPIARDVAEYRGSLFYANVTEPARLTVRLLATGAPNGVQAGDTIEIAGTTFSAATVEAAQGFVVASAGTVAEDIRDTAQSLVRAINRTPTSAVIARYASGENDSPGIISLELTSGSSLAFTPSRAASWSLGAPSPVTAVQRKNRLYWSKAQQPEAVPLLYYADVGSADKAILRIVPIRSALFIFKEDGLWILSGSSSPWSIQPFDPTCVLKAPESAVPLDNSVFAFTNQGAVRVNESGVTVLSRDIEPELLPLIAPDMLAVTSAYAFALGYDSDREYRLYVPGDAGDTQAVQGWVYNLFTRAWYRDTRDFAHGIVNPADDRMYFVDGTSVWRERKSYDATDYADGTDPIECEWSWAPHYGSSPGHKHHFTTVNALYRRAGVEDLTFTFSTDTNTTPTTQAIDFTAYGSLPLAPLAVQTMVPRDSCRGSQLFVKMSQAVLDESFQFQGLGIVYRTTTREAGS